MTDSLPKLSSQMELEVAEKEFSELEGQWMVSALFLMVDAAGTLFSLLALFCFPSVFGRFAATGSSLGFIALSLLVAELLNLFFSQERFRSTLEKSQFLIPCIHALCLLVILLPAVLVCVYEYLTGHGIGFGWTCLHLILCSWFGVCGLKLFRQKLIVRKCEQAIVEEVGSIMDELIYSEH